MENNVVYALMLDLGVGEGSHLVCLYSNKSEADDECDKLNKKFGDNLYFVNEVEIS